MSDDNWVIDDDDDDARVGCDGDDDDAVHQWCLLMRDNDDDC